MWNTYALGITIIVVVVYQKGKQTPTKKYEASTEKSEPNPKPTKKARSEKQLREQVEKSPNKRKRYMSKNKRTTLRHTRFPGDIFCLEILYRNIPFVPSK